VDDLDNWKLRSDVDEWEERERQLTRQEQEDEDKLRFGMEN